MAQANLFAALNVSKINDLIYMLEHRINLMVNSRHEYPIWPLHDGQPDDFEREFHEPVRHVYYQTTIVLIHTLRDLRKAI